MNKTLKINFCHDAEPVRDLEAEDSAKKVIDLFLSQEEDMTVETSNEIYVQAVRALVKEQYIDSRYMEIQYLGNTLELDEFGGIAHWPEGFCDVYDKLLMRLLDW